MWWSSLPTSTDSGCPQRIGSGQTFQAETRVLVLWGGGPWREHSIVIRFRRIVARRAAPAPPHRREQQRVEASMVRCATSATSRPWPVDTETAVRWQLMLLMVLTCDPAAIAPIVAALWALLRSRTPSIVMRQDLRPVLHDVRLGPFGRHHQAESRQRIGPNTWCVQHRVRR